MTDRFTGTDRYVPTRDLTLAVNAAIALQRPLLIKVERKIMGLPSIWIYDVQMPSAP